MCFRFIEIRWGINIENNFDYYRLLSGNLKKETDIEGVFLNKQQIDKLIERLIDIKEQLD